MTTTTSDDGYRRGELCVISSFLADTTAYNCSQRPHIIIKDDGNDDGNADDDNSDNKPRRQRQ